MRGFVSTVVIAGALALAGCACRAGARRHLAGRRGRPRRARRLAVGGAIGAANADPYYPGRPVYRAPRPVYVEEDYGPVCHVVRRRYVDAYGDMIVRRERVCE